MSVMGKHQYTLTNTTAVAIRSFINLKKINSAFAANANFYYLYGNRLINYKLHIFFNLPSPSLSDFIHENVNVSEHQHNIMISRYMQMSSRVLIDYAIGAFFF
jgi:hypothetical protein